MSSYPIISTIDKKSLKGIVQDALFIFAFFPTMKFLVTIMDFTIFSELKIGKTSILDYAIQLISFGFIIYYINSKKLKK